MDARDQRIEALEARVEKLLARVEEQDRRISALEAENRALKVENVELRARLNQNSTNSSKPPSSDPPGVDRQPKSPTGRKPGGQPGHKPHKRELLPVEEVDKVVDLVPKTCGRCEARLFGKDVEPVRHQVTEIPPISPFVTEYRCHALTCGRCGAESREELPGEVRSAFGERLAATVCVLVGKYRLSKRLVQDALADLLGVELALGSVSNLEQEVSAALESQVAEAEEFVREQNVVHADETGWAEGRHDGRARRAWLWVAASALVSVFRISRSRGSEVAKSLLDGFVGFLVTDRWSAYNWYDAGLRQLCWSHLTRDFQGFIDRGREGARIGRLLMNERDKMFRWWHRVRDKSMSRRDFVERMKKVESRVGRLLREAVVRAEAKTAGMAKEMLKLEHAMWTFVQVESLEPTNNFGERTIRHAVMFRKTSFGTQSPDGSRFVERILTAVTSLRAQKRNVLEHLTETLRAHRRSQRAPSLLPRAPISKLAIAA